MTSLFNLKLASKNILTNLSLIAALICVQVGIAQSAELKLSGSPYCQAKLDGGITTGDTDRLIKFVKDNNLIAGNVDATLLVFVPEIARVQPTCIKNAIIVLGIAVAGRYMISFDRNHSDLVPCTGFP